MKTKFFFFLTIILLHFSCTKKFEELPKTKFYIATDLSRLQLPTNVNPVLNNVTLTVYLGGSKWPEGHIFPISDIKQPVVISKGSYQAIALEAKISYVNNGATTTIDAIAYMSNELVSLVNESATGTFFLEKKK